MSPGVAKRVPSSPTATTAPVNNLDIELEKNLKNLNLSPMHQYQSLQQANTKATRKLREMTPDSIDDPSQPNSVTNSFNEHILDYEPLTSLQTQVTHLPANPALQVPPSTIPLTIPISLPLK